MKKEKWGGYKRNKKRRDEERAMDLERETLEGKKKMGEENGKRKGMRKGGRDVDKRVRTTAKVE